MLSKYLRSSCFKFLLPSSDSVICSTAFKQRIVPAAGPVCHTSLARCFGLNVELSRCMSVPIDGKQTRLRLVLCFGVAWALVFCDTISRCIHEECYHIQCSFQNKTKNKKKKVALRYNTRYFETLAALIFYNCYVHGLAIFLIFWFQFCHLL